MKALRNRRVAVVTGDGLVGRTAHGLIIVHGHPDAIDTLLADAPPDSEAGVERLRRVATSGLPTGIGGLVVVTEDGDGIEVTTAGPEHVSVDGIEPAPERHGDARVRLIHHTGVIRLGVAFGRAGAAHDLRAGLVPGAGIVLSAATGDAAASDDVDRARTVAASTADADPTGATPPAREPVTAFEAEPAIDPDPARRSPFEGDPDIDPDPVPSGSSGSRDRPATQLTEIQPPLQPQTTQIPPQPTPAPAAAAADHTAFDVFDLSDDAGHDRAPLPTAVSDDTTAPDSAQLVRGILCSRQHFNNPLARYCQVCGTAMVPQDHSLVERPRPTLGFVVFDDGTTFALDRSYAIGRESPEIDDPDVTPLIVDDPEHSVSRRHAELRLDGWDVIVRDVGSSNGTRVWDPSTSSWQRLQPGDPLVLDEGTYVAVGRRVFVFEPAVRT